MRKMLIARVDDVRVALIKRFVSDQLEFVGIASKTNPFWTSVRLPMAFALNLVALSILLPSIGGWGVREVSYVALLGSLSPPVSPDAAAIAVAPAAPTAA